METVMHEVRNSLDLKPFIEKQSGYVFATEWERRFFDPFFIEDIILDKVYEWDCELGQGQHYRFWVLEPLFNALHSQSTVELRLDWVGKNFRIDPLEEDRSPIYRSVKSALEIYL